VVAGERKGDAHCDAMVVRNHEAGHHIGSEKKGLGLDNAPHVGGGEAGVVSIHSGEMSFSNDIEDPHNGIEADGPLKRSVGTTHAKPLDQRDERTGKPTSANADVPVESDDVEPPVNPDGHGEEGPAGA
jgi:hypothetical protein